MGVTNILSLLMGVALFLFGMSLMGDALKRAAGESLETVLYNLTNTPFKGVLLGTIVTAIVQSSSATMVMIVGFVNSGMMKVAQAIGIIMGANIGTSVTGWILSLSYIEGGSGIASLLSTATISAIVAIVGIVIKMAAKNIKIKNVGDIMLGFAILMNGMQMMSGSVQPLRSDPRFLNAITMFSNPFMGILLGIAITAVLQSASASIGILQSLSAAGTITFATAFPITMGVGVGAAVPVLLSSIGANKNGKRTAIVYLLVDLFGLIVWTILFYSAHYFIQFSFMDMEMTPVRVALLNSVFRIATVVVLFPFIPLIEKLVCAMVKDTEEDEADQKDFELLEERFLGYPALALGRCHTAFNSMAKKAKKNVFRAFDLFINYKDSQLAKVESKETLIDKYEDKLGVYLMQLNGQELTAAQSRETSILLRTLTDLERLSDHAVNLAYSAKELQEKKLEYSEEALSDLNVLTLAVKDILNITIDSFVESKTEAASRTEPLREYIMSLCDEMASRHIARLQDGTCGMKQSFTFNNILVDCERIASHCSNIAIALLEMKYPDIETHNTGQFRLAMGGSDAYDNYYDEYRQKYALPERIKKS